MSPAGRLVPYAVLISLFASLFISSMPRTALGDVSCTKGTSRPATAADIETMKAAGIVNATVGEEYCPGDLNAGADAGQAKQYLRSILCPPDKDNYGGLGPDGTIQKLDGEFAVCAAKFLKAGQSAGINVCIREGARTVAKQEQYVRSGVIACKKGAMCEHPRGIAIDVNVRPNVNGCPSYARLHAAAGQFGLSFYMGCKDAYHFRPLKGGCYGGGTIPDDAMIPASDYDYPQYAPVPPPPPLPSSGISSGIRSALGMTPAPAVTPASTAQTQPQICSPEFSCTNNTMYYKTTSCTSQVYQTCPYGCDGNSCNLSTSTAATGINISTVLTGTSTGNTNTNTDTEATSTTSVSDLLNSYMNPKAVEIGTSTSITFVLNPETGDIEQISQSPGKSVSKPPQNTISSIQPVNGQQTFTSSDLSGSPGTFYAGTQATTFGLVLENMKQALLRALSVLRPFGGGSTNLQFAP